MTIKLRDYQERLLSGIFNAWGSGHNAVVAVSPTGSGKAFTLAEAVKRNAEPTCVMVHRGELVAQLSETLATLGITHRVIASKSTVAMCAARHVRKFGRSFIHPQSPVGVASVQTLVRRGDKIKQWSQEVKLVVADECHHYLADNQFGTAVAMFPNAKLLGVTATPDRTDRKSLARVQKTGLFDILIEGPTPRWLIDQGYLSPYKYYAPPPSFTIDENDVSKNTGEVRPDAMRKKSHESRIVGDVVDTYKKLALGKQAIAFVVDVATATELSEAFNAAGVRAAAVSGKTPDSLRNALMGKFEDKFLQVLVNVDLFDEGLDLPGVECVIMARPTMSLGKFRQQIGRALRPVYASGYNLTTQAGRLAAITNGPKHHAILLDHVENWKIHKFPDSERIWSLIREDTRRSKNRDDEIPLRSCVNCFQPYEATHVACPHCGHKPEPASRSAPEFVDGDIVEFSPELIAKLSGEVSRVDGAPQIPHGASEIVKRSIEKRWRERQEAQQALRHTIALWAGHGRDAGKDDSTLYREFFHRFGLDVLSAQALGATEADALLKRIDESLGIRYEAVTDLPGVM